MTPQEALDLLNTNVAQLRGTREDHLQLQNAVQVLQEIVPPPVINTPEKEIENG